MTGRVIRLKYAGKCVECGARLEVGEKATWYGAGQVKGKGCCTVHNGYMHQNRYNYPPNGEEQAHINAYESRYDAVSAWEPSYGVGEDR